MNDTEWDKQPEEIQGGYLRVPLSTVSGRMAARAYAYSLIAEGKESEGQAILDEVEEEG